MFNYTIELIKNLLNNVSVEEIFRGELEKVFNQFLEAEFNCYYKHTNAPVIIPITGA